MAGLFDTFTIAKRGLSVQNGNINTSAHNIANASTEGYSRQTNVVQTTRPAGGTSKFECSAAGQVGTGAQITTITRIRNEFVDYQLREANGKVSNSQVTYEFLSKIEDILGETSDTGIQGLVSQFYSSLQSLTTASSSTSVKGVVLQNALTLTNNLNSVYTQLEKQLSNAQEQLGTQISEVNGYLDQINDLNKQISRMTALGQTPNDLMDSRDLLIDKVSLKFGINIDKQSLNTIDLNSNEYDNLEMVKSDPNDIDYNRFSTCKSAEVIDNKDGTYSLKVEYYPNGDKSASKSFTVNGTSEKEITDLKNELEQCQILIADKDGNVNIDGENASELKKIIFNTYQDKSGTNLATNLVKGEIAGTQSVQDTIKGYMADLDKLAASIAYTMNAIQTGTTDSDLKDAVSQNLIFTNSSTSNSDDHISAKNITVNKSLLDNADLLNCKPGEESGSGANDRAQAMAALNQIKFDYGSLKSNSSSWTREDFLNDTQVKFSNDDTTDAEKNISLAGNVGSTMVVFYSGIISKLGSDTKAAYETVSNQNILLQNLENQRLSESGVSLDEEMTDLVQFQHAYQANAKMISTINDLLDVVINGLVR